MTTNAFFMALAAGAFAVLCVVAWHLVQVLKQVGRTAVAVEDFLVSTRPRVEAATDKLDSLIARADRILATAEHGQGALATVAGSLASAVAGWSTGGRIISTFSSVVAGLMQVWRSVRTAGDETAAGAEPAGGSHE